MIKTNCCIECNEDTSFQANNEKFINRIPADNGELDGWLCADCLEEIEKEFEENKA